MARDATAPFEDENKEAERVVRRRRATRQVPDDDGPILNPRAAAIHGRAIREASTHPPHKLDPRQNQSYIEDDATSIHDNIDVDTSTGRAHSDSRDLVHEQDTVKSSMHNNDDTASIPPISVDHTTGLVDFAEEEIQGDLGVLFGERVLRKWTALPINQMLDGSIRIAMANTGDVFALDDMSQRTGRNLIPVLADRVDIIRQITKMFAESEDIENMLSQTEDEYLDARPEEMDLDQVITGDSAVIKFASSIIQEAAHAGASDIHVEPRRDSVVIRMRIDGVLHEKMRYPAKASAQLISRLKILSNLDIGERRKPQDGRFSVKLTNDNVDIRVASLPGVYGEKIVMRLLDSSKANITLGELGIPPAALDTFSESYALPYGCILVTGPTGSGKSTTLYSTLHELATPDKNVITVEDPVEYRMDEITQVQVNPVADLTFASALKSILRSDPDIIMIGEIRDHETAKIAVEAALTGHLVLATLHTNDAPSAPVRLADMGVEPFLTGYALECVVAQRLVRKLCAKCKRPMTTAELDAARRGGMADDIDSAVERARREFANDIELPQLFVAEGCASCGNTGYKGRLGVYEIMRVNEEIQNLVTSKSPANDISAAAERSGMVRLRSDGLMKAVMGQTSITEILKSTV